MDGVQAILHLTPAVDDGPDWVVFIRLGSIHSMHKNLHNGTAFAMSPSGDELHAQLDIDGTADFDGWDSAAWLLAFRQPAAVCGERFHTRRVRAGVGGVGN